MKIADVAKSGPRRFLSSSLKTYREITSPIRLMPNFIIIGVQKGGTTSLYNYLIEHTNIIPASMKEVHFFDRNYQKGPSWYRAHFPSFIHKYYAETLCRQHFLTGEASPYYLFHPHAPRRIAQLLPQVKLVALLRNPADRLYSHYCHEVQLGHETLSLEDAIACEEERTGREREKLMTDEHYYSYNYQHFTYLERGKYVDQLQRWFNFFPREQMLLLKSEDLYADPAAVFKQTLEFLGIPCLVSGRLQKEYKQYNKSKEASSKMKPALRQCLVEYYKSHNALLYELLGRDFGWDK